MTQDPEGNSPRDDGIYRTALVVLAVSVLLGAVLTLTGETLFGNRALANAGLGMALIAGAGYWVFRLLGRRAARKHDAERKRD